MVKIFRPNASLSRLADAGFLSLEFLWTHQLKVVKTDKTVPKQTSVITAVLLNTHKRV